MQVRPASAEAVVVAIARTGAGDRDDEVQILSSEELALMRRQAAQARAEANQQVKRAVEMQRKAQALRALLGKGRQ
jgi:hypothetical protein